MDRDELIARIIDPKEWHNHDGLKRVAANYPVDAASTESEANRAVALSLDKARAILAALESRPAPTEERAQATLEQWMGGDHIPTRAQIIAAMIDFATNTTPSRDEEGSVAVLREIWLEAHETIPRDGEDAAFAALGRILEITSRALKTSTPETQTVEGGGQ